jgi:CheY-like chemotaxis protein
MANGLEAQALRSGLFDCVLLEVLMPEMDGYQVLEHIRSDPKLRHTPVIMISALEDTESVIRCIEISRDGTRLIRKIPIHVEPAHPLGRTQLVKGGVPALVENGRA